MYFPLFINLDNKEVLIIGGGKVANRKATILLEYGANITVYSENIINEDLKKRENIKFILKNINNDNEEIKKIIKNYTLVIVATDNKNLNDKISNICMDENILVNNVSSKKEMNVRFGAIVKNDEFHIAISTNGKSCKRSRALKEKIKELIDKIV